MKKTLLIIGIVSLAFVQCGKDSDPFLIKNGSIGNLNKEIKMKQMEVL